MSLVAIIALACGDESDSSIDVDDEISFIDTNGKSFVMNADDERIKPLDNSLKTLKTWRSQQRILQSFCGGFGLANFTAPVFVVSPDGALIGELDNDNWHPEWSSDGKWLAVACGRDDEMNVYVVSNYEVSGTSEGWSREKSNLLSDLIEIYVVKPDGSSITKITDNESGDWLPRWKPGYYQIVFESNRDGNSEIYSAITDSSWRQRLTERPSKDQSPAWGANGNVIAFSSNASGNSRIHLIPLFEAGYTRGLSINSDLPTDQTGFPVPYVK